MDRHYLIESPTTFTGRPKPLFFTENASLFKKYPITPIVIELPFQGDVLHPWDNDRDSRNFGFARIVELLVDDDVILISDVDEIPRGSRVLEAPGKTVTFLQRTYTYYLNYQSPEVWVGTIRMPVARLKEMGGMSAYRYRWAMEYNLEDAGWHFSYQGGLNRVQYKLQAAAHTEYATPYYTNSERLREKFKTGEDLFDRIKDGFKQVSMDGLPRYLQEHPERFAGLICS